MRVCVFGAGAVGGHLAVRLAANGGDVSVVARGDHLRAIQANGLELRIGDAVVRARLRAVEDPGELGRQDLVVAAVKAPALPTVVDGLRRLLADATPIVYALNGIPWWYFHRHGGSFEGLQFPFLDPGGRLWRELGAWRAVGCVVLSANEVIEPGVILNRSPSRNRLVLGEPDRLRAGRAHDIAAALSASGMDVPVIGDIRSEIWRKFLAGNMTFSLLAALTGAPADRIAADPELSGVARRLVGEGIGLAARLGAVVDEPAMLALLEPAKVPPGNRPSMLQDLERGRPMEIDAMVTAVQALARLVGEEMPVFSAIAALLKLRATTAGCYQSPASPTIAAAASLAARD